MVQNQYRNQAIHCLLLSRGSGIAIPWWSAQHGAKTHNYNSQKTRRLKTSWGDGCCIQSFYISENSTWDVRSLDVSNLRGGHSLWTLYPYMAQHLRPATMLWIWRHASSKWQPQPKPLQRIRIRIENQFPVSYLWIWHDIAGSVLKIRWVSHQEHHGSNIETEWSNRLWTLPMTWRGIWI